MEIILLPLWLFLLSPLPWLASRMYRQFSNPYPFSKKAVHLQYYRAFVLPDAGAGGRS